MQTDDVNNVVTTTTVALFRIVTGNERGEKRTEVKTKRNVIMRSILLLRRRRQTW